jgi:hypothetical protein
VHRRRRAPRARPEHTPRIAWGICASRAGASRAAAAPKARLREKRPGSRCIVPPAGPEARPCRGQPGHRDGRTEDSRAIGRALASEGPGRCNLRRPSGPSAKPRRSKPGPGQRPAAADRDRGKALPRPAGPPAMHCHGRPGPRQGTASAGRARGKALPRPCHACQARGEALPRPAEFLAGPCCGRPGPRRGFARGGNRGRGAALPRGLVRARCCRDRPGPPPCPAGGRDLGDAGPRCADLTTAWPGQWLPDLRRGIAKGRRAHGNSTPSLRFGNASGKALPRAAGPWQCHAARAGAPAKPG